MPVDGTTDGQSAEAWMRMALDLAREAASVGEVPIGAVVVQDGRVTGSGANRTRADHLVSSHAEMIALAEAERLAGDYRLIDADIYVTVEPCLMCLGAIHQSRVRRLFYGATEPKFGALGGCYDLAGHTALARLEITGGVLAEESVELLGTFFRDLRGTNNG